MFSAVIEENRIREIFKERMFVAFLPPPFPEILEIWTFSRAQGYFLASLGEMGKETAGKIEDSSKLFKTLFFTCMFQKHTGIKVSLCVHPLQLNKKYGSWGYKIESPQHVLSNIWKLEENDLCFTIQVICSLGTEFHRGIGTVSKESELWCSGGGDFWKQSSPAWGPSTRLPLAWSRIKL